VNIGRYLRLDALGEAPVEVGVDGVHFDLLQPLFVGLFGHSARRLLHLDVVVVVVVVVVVEKESSGEKLGTSNCRFLVANQSPRTIERFTCCGTAALSASETWWTVWPASSR